MKLRLLAEALADIEGTADYYQQYDNKLAKAFVEEDEDYIGGRNGKFSKK